ncbi:MAG: hypothetical protein JJE04_03870 [Acidobacteriia bacterium]|nr:hypothetical protein [Terriglobia bacterium]
MTRRFLISVMSLMLAGTIVWARCAGCLPSTPKPEHSHSQPSKGKCCDPGGDCPATPAEKCAGEAPWHDAAAKTETHTFSEPDMAPVIVAVPVPHEAQAHEALPDSGYSPPERTILYSSFLI